MLLDTHVWVAVVSGDRRRIGPRARRLLDWGAARGHLYLSVLSMFELAALHLTARVQLATPVETWIRESIDRGALRVSEVTVAIAVDGGTIPSTVLPDPLDRLLVATARQLDVPFVTRDQRILEYAAASSRVRVVNAAR